MFGNMRLGMKIASSFVALVLLSMLVGGAGYWGMSKLSNIAGDLGSRTIKSDALGDINEAQTAIKSAERTLMISGLDRALVTRQLEDIKRSWERLDKALKSYESLPRTPEAQALWEKNLTAWNVWKKDHQEFMRLNDEYMRSGNNPALVARLQLQGLETNYRSFVDAEKALGALMEFNQRQAVEQRKVAQKTEENSLYILFGILALSLLLALGMGFLFVRSINALVRELLAETERLVTAAIGGKLDTRGNVKKINFEFRGIVEGINKTLDAVIGPLNVAAEYVDRISKGDIPPKITDNYNGDFNEIKNNLNQCIDAVNMLVADANMLSIAAVEGKLDTRADASKHGGDFRKIVEGVNKTLDAVIGPLNVAAEYVDRISKGDIPPKITDKYNGDFNEIKNNLNNAIDNINALVVDANMLSIAAVEGKLATRADAAKHGGDYRKIVEGVNKTLDAVIGPLNVAAEYVDKISKGNIPPKITDSYNGDFNTIKNNLNQCVEAVNGLIAESSTLARAAVEGRLQTRGRVERFEGGYQAIVQGVNETLDAVLKPITEAAECLKEMAQGNLNVYVRGDYKGDHAIIKDALNSTIEAMNEILSQVSMAVEQVSAGSREIATSSQALSQGATESASAVEEISSSMQEMASQTNQNAENATQANQLAVVARDNAEKGNGQMTRMVQAMGEINQSANNISKIIKVIDEIAFQTNLLALNAAVEAARAGKHGKGFTVVAEEVRNLAQRSAKAAKETTEMIEESIKRTEVGTAIAENTSKALEEIVVGATKVTDLISEIAAASKEQAQGIGQINTGLGQVDQVTQQNTASAEEMASAGEELSSQSLQLKQMLAKFQLKRTTGSAIGGGYGGDPYETGPGMKQIVSRQRPDVPWGGIAAKSGRKTSRGVEIKPEEVISLDDQNFGKF